MIPKLPLPFIMVSKLYSIGVEDSEMGGKEAYREVFAEARPKRISG